MGLVIWHTKNCIGKNKLHSYDCLFEMVFSFHIIWNLLFLTNLHKCKILNVKSKWNLWHLRILMIIQNEIFQIFPQMHSFSPQLFCVCMRKLNRQLRIRQVKWKWSGNMEYWASLKSKQNVNMQLEHRSDTIYSFQFNVRINAYKTNTRRERERDTTIRAT